MGYALNPDGTWSGASHKADGIELVAGAPGYDVNKAARYLGEIASYGNTSAAQVLKDAGLTAKAAGLWEEARYRMEDAERNRGPRPKTADEKLAELTGQYSALNTQLTDLQKSYDALSKKNTAGSTGGLTQGGATVDAGGSNIDLTNSGGATTGPVYGPDGRMYSSAASAIAAGVTNYTRTKPTGILAGADNMGAGGGGTASRGFMSDNVNAGNINPGGLIANQSKQLFNPAINVNLPGGIKNPYTI